MDQKIQEILDAPEGNTARDQLELAVMASGTIEIAGHPFPAPAAAAIATLGLIGSPFVGEEDVEFDDLAVFHALYILSSREKVLGSILRWKRREEALERWKEECSSTESPQAMLIIGEMLKEIADAKARFDEEALLYGEKLGAFDIASAASEIGTYLSLAGGFDMLPDGDGEKKRASMILTS